MVVSQRRATPALGATPTLEGQRHKGIGRCRLAFGLAPQLDEVGNARVATAVAGRLDLEVQRLGGAALTLGSSCIGLQGPLDRMWNAVSISRCSPRWYFDGPSTWPCTHFATVLRDSLIMREVLRSELLRRLCKRRILPIMSMVITPGRLLHTNTAG